MSLSTKVGAFNSGTGAASTTVAVTGVGFTPKVILFWWSGRTGTIDAVGRATHQRGIGWCVDASNNFAVATKSQDAQASSNTSQDAWDGQCIYTILAASDAADGTSSLQSYDADGFTLVINDAFSASIRIHYLAIGGDDLTNVVDGSFVEPSTATTQDVTSVGFQPDCVIFLANASGAVSGGVAADSRMMFGIVDTALGNAVWAAGADDNVTTMNSLTYCRSGESLANLSPTLGSVNSRGAVSALLSNGFTVSWNEVNGTATREYGYLALKGGKYLLGNFTTTAAATAIVETGFGFQPKAALMVSGGSAESAADTPANGDEWIMGAFSATNARGSQTIEETDGAADSTVTTAVEHDNVYVATNGAGGVDARIDITSVDPNGFTVTPSLMDATGRFVFWLAFGDTPVTPNPRMSIKYGSFNLGLGAVSSTVVIADVEFQPSAILFWWSGRIEDYNTVGRISHQRGMGYAGSASSRHAVATQSQDAVNPSNNDQSVRNDCCIFTLDTAGATDGLADLQSMDSGGFTLIIDDAFSTATGNLRVDYLAIGGSDITSVIRGSLTEPSVTGTQAITGLGFQPACVFLMTYGTANDPPFTVGDSRMTFGVAAGSPIVNATIANGSNNAVTPTQSQSYCMIGESLTDLDVNVTNTNSRGYISSFDSDGFTVTWNEVNGAADRDWMYAAIGGGQYFIGSLTMSTTLDATQAQTGFGFPPVGALFVSADRAASTADTPTALDEWCIGAFSSLNERGFHAVRDADNVATSEVSTAHRQDAVFGNLKLTSIDNRLDISSIDADGFTTIVDQTDGVDAPFIWYLAFGASPAVSSRLATLLGVGL